MAKFLFHLDEDYQAEDSNHDISGPPAHQNFADLFDSSLLSAPNGTVVLPVNKQCWTTVTDHWQSTSGPLVLDHHLLATS
jgi:hypothetical protein